MSAWVTREQTCHHPNPPSPPPPLPHPSRFLSMLVLGFVTLERLSKDGFDLRTPTGSHYFGIMYCLTVQHERETASSHVRDFLPNTSTHALWLQCRNSDFRLMSVNQKLRAQALLPIDKERPIIMYTVVAHLPLGIKMFFAAQMHEVTNSSAAGP